MLSSLINLIDFELRRPRAFNLFAQLDSRAVELEASDVLGCSLYEVNMRCAEEALRLIKQRWASVDRIVLVCAQDDQSIYGLFLAELAAKSFFNVTVLMLAVETPVSESFTKALISAQKQASISWISDKTRMPFNDVELIVDALPVNELGNSDSSQAIAFLVQAINDSKVDVLSLHQPAGLNPCNGIAQKYTIRAAVTLSFLHLPLGLLMNAGLEYCGDVFFSDAEMPPHLFETLSTRLAKRDKPVQLNNLTAQGIGRRSADSYKNVFGHVLIVGGDKGYAGAAIIAAKAAAKAGAGLVSFASHPEHLTAMLASCPDVIAHSVISGQEIEPMLAVPDVIVVGPGMIDSAWSRQLLRACLESNKPLIVDAGALSLLSEFSAAGHRDDWIILPHPGEAANLLGSSSQAIQSERLASVVNLQSSNGGVAVLKGAGTLIASHDQILLSPFANSALASAGMGDVLAGVTGAMVAQGESLKYAAARAVNLHLAAANHCSKTMANNTVLTEDILAAFAVVLK